MVEYKEKKTWKKVLLSIVIVLALGFAILVGVFVYNDLQTEGKLNREVEEIEDILNATEFDEKLFQEKIDHCVSTGDYYKVERAYKNYLRDYYKLTNKIVDFYESINVDNILSIENIKTDGKDFVQTRILLDSYGKKFDTLKEKFDSMSNEKHVMSYLKEDMDEYYVDYFKEIIGDVRQTSEEKELSNYLSLSSDQIKNVKAIFDFLSKNKDHWTIDGETILFDSNELIEEYQKLLNNITKLDTEEDNSNKPTPEV